MADSETRRWPSTAVRSRGSAAVRRRLTGGPAPGKGRWGRRRQRVTLAEAQQAAGGGEMMPRGRQGGRVVKRHVDGRTGVVRKHALKEMPLHVFALKNKPTSLSRI